MQSRTPVAIRENTVCGPILHSGTMMTTPLERFQLEARTLVFRLVCTLLSGKNIEILNDHCAQKNRDLI
jgi:hypothetical protein